MSALLTVENLNVRFRTMGRWRAKLAGVADPFIDAVLGVSFTLKPGTTFGLVGESGSGKSTLGRSLLGLVPGHTGRICFDGVDADNWSGGTLGHYHRNMAMMFQDPVASLSPRMTVKALITEPFVIHGDTNRNLDAEARRLLDMVSLPQNFADRYPHQLSGGQARRVGVARALALSPKLIVADEPTAGLDVSVQGEILNLMTRLQRELGLSYLIITHNLAVARHISDELAVMYMGRFIEHGPTETVFANPSHPYTHGLLAAQPHPDPDKRRETVELQGEVPSLARRPAGCEFHTRCPHAQAACRSVSPSPRGITPHHKVRCLYPLDVVGETR